MFGDSSGRSTGGARAPRLFLDQNEARRTEKSFFEAGPPLIWKSGSATDIKDIGVWAKTAKGYFKNVEEQVILLQSKVWSNL